MVWRTLRQLMHDHSEAQHAETGAARKHHCSLMPRRGMSRSTMLLQACTKQRRFDDILLMILHR
jgi:hypothetical protein